jgi:hypothetical protein
LLKEIPSVIESEVLTGLKASEAIDADTDLQIFIESNKTPKDLVAPFVFEPVCVLCLWVVFWLR